MVRVFLFGALLLLLAQLLHAEPSVPAPINENARFATVILSDCTSIAY